MAMHKHGRKIASQRAIFLDRDGTIIEEINYLREPNQIRLLASVIPALQRLQEHFRLVLVTNQAGIARGYLDEDTLRHIHHHLEARLAMASINLAGVYYCPHHPEVGDPPYRQECKCRKPHPGMLLAASRDLALDLSGSYTIGDKLSDIAAGINAGTHTGLVRTGYGIEHENQVVDKGIYPDFIGNDLLAVANWILGTCRRPQATNQWPKEPENLAPT